MALLAPSPPDQAAEAVQSTFRALAEHRTFRSPGLRKATGPLQLVEPHQVFTLVLHDLVAGRGLEAAKSTGWLYLVQEGDKVLASAEAVRTGTGDEHVFSAFNEGPFVARPGTDRLGGSEDFVAFLHEIEPSGRLGRL